jgi:cation:H+ antiporter
MVSPAHVSNQVLQFYLPVTLVTVLFLSLVMLRKRVPRWAGAILVLLYLLFVAGGYVPL